MAYNREVERLPDDSRWYPSRPVRRRVNASARRVVGLEDLHGTPVDQAEPADLIAAQDHHPDPACETVRWSLTEAAVLQMLGRDRAVNRDATRPVLRLVLTSVPLPLPIDGVLSRAGLERTLVSIPDLLLDTQGLFPAHAEAIAALVSERFATAQAVRDAVKGTTPADPALRHAIDAVRAGHHPACYPHALALRVRGRRRDGTRFQCAVAGVDPDLRQVALRLGRALDLEHVEVDPASVTPEKLQAWQEGLFLRWLAEHPHPAYALLPDRSVVRVADGTTVAPREALKLITLERITARRDALGAEIRRLEGAADASALDA